MGWERGDTGQGSVGCSGVRGWMGGDTLRHPITPANTPAGNFLPAHPKSLRSAPLPQQDMETRRILSSWGERGKAGKGRGWATALPKDKVSVAKPLSRDPRRRAPPCPPPQHHFIAGGREGGEQKVSGLEKGDCESHWLWMETEQERAEGEVKNSPSSVGGWGGGCWGGHGDRLGCGEGWEGRGHGLGKEGEELDWERLGSWEHIWMGEPRVTVRTAGLGATAGWVALGCQWEQMEGGDGGTSGWESPGMAMGTAGGGQWGAHLGGRAPGSR